MMTTLFAHADHAPHLHLGQYALYLTPIIAAAVGGAVALIWKLRSRSRRQAMPQKEGR